MGIAGQDGPLVKTQLSDAIYSADVELRAIEELLGLHPAREEEAKKLPGASSDALSRLVMHIEIALDVGSRLAEVKNVLLGLKETVG